MPLFVMRGILLRKRWIFEELKQLKIIAC